MKKRDRAAAAAILALILVCAPAIAQDKGSSQGRALSNTEMFMTGADANRIDVVLHFLAKGVDPNVRGKNGFTALMVAAGKGSLEVAELLLARGADVNLANDEGLTALMQAIRRGRQEVADRLLRAGARLDVREKRYGLTPLMIAAKADSPNLVSALLAKGAEIDAADTRSGLTALHLALASTALKSPLIVGELLVRGADAGKAATDGFTPLMAAVRSGSVDKAMLILSEEPDVNSTTKDGRTALSIAAGAGKPELVRHLLTAGARPVPARGVASPLAQAVRGGSLDAVKLLVEARADVDRPGRDGRTPLILAVLGGHDEIVRLLLDRGGKANIRNTKDGTTALMWAANTGRRSLVELLLKHGADAKIAAKDGWTAGEAARVAGHEEIARLLERRI
ncbi:MAG: ankyrin repeat domain-containing protein [Hyphomicrobiales bacterium]|nr:ankyrin repeat domain-containing protein [Hyphomicrobiales bacterium]